MLHWNEGSKIGFPPVGHYTCYDQSNKATQMESVVEDCFDYIPNNVQECLEL